MEKLLRYIAEQNRYFDPKDSISILIDQTLNSIEDELSEEDLYFVQAARGPAPYKSTNHRKGTKQI